MPALTREEAVQRRRLLEVHDVSVDLDLTGAPKGLPFRSRTVIRFACAEPGAASFVDVKPAALLRAELNGRPLDPGALNDGRLPVEGLAAENELLVEADMAYSATGEGMHRFTDPEDGETYLYTHAFLDEGPRIFASFDQPDLKARYRLTAAAPEGWTLVGNTTAQHAAGRWEFEPTEPISSYLVALVAGPLHSVRAEHDGIPLGLHCRRSLARHLDADAEELLAVTTACLDHYHGIFRERYPFGSYDQCFVPQFNPGAMENPGCVTIREEYVFRSAVTESQREERAIVVAHEMAHMWFGDLVTLRWWDDIWLNESFAEYMGQQVVAEATAFRSTWAGFAAKRKTWGYDADQRPSTHPVAAEDVRDSAQALQNFDGISYSKGAAALRQLVAWLGEEAFLAGVNEHFARHRFGNAALGDLLDALTAAGGRDVRGWAERWLRTTGVDTLGLRLSEQEGKVTAAEVVRTAPPGAGGRPHRIGVGCYDRLPEGGLARTALLSVDVPAQGGAPVPELAGALRPDLVLPNDGDLSYAKIRLDPHSWAAACRSLGAVPDETARAVLWTTARDLVRDAEMPAEEYLALMVEHLPQETSVHLVEGSLDFARGQLVDTFLSPAKRSAGLAVLAEVCRELIRRTEGEPAGAGVRLLAVRGLIGASHTAVEAAELQQWLVEDTVPGGPVLDPELRWRILLRLAVTGVIDAAGIAAELERDPSSSGQESAARCRAALPDSAAKELAWHQVLHGGLSAYLLTATLQGFWQPEQADLLAPFIPRYFAEAPAAAGRGPAVGVALGRRGFPGYAVDRGTIEAAEECLGRDDLTPAFRRALADRLDDTRRALRVREGEGR